MARKKAKPGKSPFPIEFETFMPICAYELGSLRWDNPSSFNGMTRVRKYRVRIEAIEEPDEVIIDRLITLYKTVETYRDRDHIMNYAEGCGFNIDWKAVKEQGNGLL
jgi:hypothetical protein